MSIPNSMAIHPIKTLKNSKITKVSRIQFCGNPLEPRKGNGGIFYGTTFHCTPTTPAKEPKHSHVSATYTALSSHGYSHNHSYSLCQSALAGESARLTGSASSLQMQPQLRMHSLELWSQPLAVYRPTYIHNTISQYSSAFLYGSGEIKNVL